MLAVGRHVAKKGFDVLVDACAVLRRRGIAFEAAIVGQEDKHARRDARSGSPQHGLEQHVHLPGPMGQDELLREYRRASALCMPSRLLPDDRDGIPNVLVEAMAAGTPVIASAVSGIPELVEHEVNGLLVAPEDPEALADALLRLHDDPALAATLAGSGRETVASRFDGDRSRPSASPRSSRRRSRDRRRARPRPVLCVTDHEHRDLEIADGVLSGRFTVAGETHALGIDPDWRTRPPRGRGVADRVGQVRVGARPRVRRRADRRPRLPGRVGAARRASWIAPGPARRRRRRGHRPPHPQLDLRVAAFCPRRRRRAPARQPRRPGRARPRQPRPRAQPPHARAVRAADRRPRAPRELDLARAGDRRARPQPADRLPRRRRPPRGLDALPRDRAALVPRRARERRRHGLELPAGFDERLARAQALRSRTAPAPTARSPRSRTPTPATTRALLGWPRELLDDRGKPRERLPRRRLPRAAQRLGPRRPLPDLRLRPARRRRPRPLRRAQLRGARERPPARARPRPRQLLRGAAEPPPLVPRHRRAQHGHGRRARPDALHARAAERADRAGALPRPRTRPGSTCSPARCAARPTRRSTSAGSRSSPTATGSSRTGWRASGSTATTCASTSRPAPRGSPARPCSRRARG